MLIDSSLHEDPLLDFIELHHCCIELVNLLIGLRKPVTVLIDVGDQVPNGVQLQVLSYQGEELGNPRGPSTGMITEVSVRAGFITMVFHLLVLLEDPVACPAHTDWIHVPWCVGS